MKTTDTKMLKLLARLDSELQREASSWRPHLYRKVAGRQTTGDARDQIVHWLAKLNDRFEFYPETLALSVAMLDRFLNTVKAHPKYLQCIGVSCFYLAAKTLEEDEVLPVTTDLVRQSGCGRSVAEVTRMERQVLDKLDWNTRLPTPLNFLHIFHALLLAHFPRLLAASTHLTPSEHLALLMHKLHACVGAHALAAFAPSTTAVALLSLELQAFRPDWLSITVVMQRLAHVDSEALIGCREAMSQLGERRSARRCPRGRAGSPRGSGAGSPPRAERSCSAKRKVDEMEEDDVYDGIRRLYDGDDAAMPCGREARQEGGGAAVTLPTAAAN